MVDAKYQVTGVGPTMAGRNGGGDLYYTDGEIWVLRLVEACQKRIGPAVTIPSPPATELKDQIWHAIANAMGNSAVCRDCSEQAMEQSAFFAALDCFAALAMTALIEYYPAPI